jgi:hypothetical protein
MPQDEKAKEQSERNSAHYEEVYRGDSIGMIAQEGVPALRRRSPLLHHVFRRSRLPDIDTELEELSVNPRRTAKRLAKLISRINRRISSGTFGRSPRILDRQRQ